MSCGLCWNNFPRKLYVVHDLGILGYALEIQTNLLFVDHRAAQNVSVMKGTACWGYLGYR